ncbi:MAG: WYL domain-containing protein [Coriobacteriia bacterium]|nr:WYL domain-containing protein [Coriobacteriia bacterium]
MARTPAAERARRLIALLGSLQQNERQPLSTLAEGLGITTAELVDDITTLSLCGIAPYDPLGLIPVIAEDGDVVAWGDIPALSGPIRLSAGEATALAAALQTAGFSATDPLVTRLLDASATDIDAVGLERVIRLDISADGTIYGQLARAIDERQAVCIDYTAPGTTGPVRREVEPHRLFAERGAWYLAAWCRSGSGWRTFRLDRIQAVQVPSQTSSQAPKEPYPERPGDVPDSAHAFGADDLPRARLLFAHAAEYTEREWPDSVVVAGAAGADAASAADAGPPLGGEGSAEGGLVVEVPYGDHRWISRKVVARLGTVEVLTPPELRESVTRLASELLGVGNL